MKLNVYLSQYSQHKADNLHALSHDELLQALYLSPHDSTASGYTLVGTATAEITLFPRVETVARQVATLRAEVQSTRAESEAKCTALERQINSLLALEDCTSEAAEDAQP